MSGIEKIKPIQPIPAKLPRKQPDPQQPSKQEPGPGEFQKELERQIKKTTKGR